MSWSQPAPTLSSVCAPPDTLITIVVTHSLVTYLLCQAVSSSMCDLCIQILHCSIAIFTPQDHPVGKGDGKYDDKRYFTCSRNHAHFTLIGNVMSEKRFSEIYRTPDDYKKPGEPHSSVVCLYCIVLLNVWMGILPSLGNDPPWNDGATKIGWLKFRCQP